MLARLGLFVLPCVHGAQVGYLHLTNQERLQQVLAVCFGTATDASLARGMPQEAVSGSSQGQGIQGESNGA